MCMAGQGKGRWSSSGHRHRAVAPPQTSGESPLSITTVTSDSTLAIASLARALDVPALVHQRLHTAPAQSLADTVGAFAGEREMLVEFYDGLHQRMELEVHQAEKSKRSAKRILDGYRVRELVDVLRRRNATPKTARALLFTPTPSAGQSMAAHVMEMYGYEVVTLGLHDLKSAPDVINMWGEVDCIVIDEAMLVGAAVRSPVLASISALTTVVADAHIYLLATGGDVRATYVDYGLTSLYSLRELASSITTSTVSPLTVRETEVLQRVAAGRSNDAIARDLGISIGTVKTYLERLHHKMNSVDRASAVATALRNGWLD